MAVCSVCDRVCNSAHIYKTMGVKIHETAPCKTNYEAAVDKNVCLTEAVDNIKGTGTAVLNGQEWSARAYEDGKTFEAGTIVKVKEIRGVTLYVVESDAMPKKAEEAEAPKESEQ